MVNPTSSWYQHPRQRMLATRWPLLKLMAQLQGTSQAGAMARGCAGLWHPSLDWKEWRHQAGLPCVAQRKELKRFRYPMHMSETGYRLLGGVKG